MCASSFSAWEMSFGGGNYTAGELRKFGYSVGDIKAAGFTALQQRHAGAGAKNCDLLYIHLLILLKLDIVSTIW